MQDKRLSLDGNWYGGPGGNQNQGDENQGGTQGQKEEDEFYSEIPRDRTKSEDDQGEKGKPEDEMEDIE